MVLWVQYLNLGPLLLLYGYTCPCATYFTHQLYSILCSISFGDFMFRIKLGGNYEVGDNGECIRPIVWWQFSMV